MRHSEPDLPGTEDFATAEQRLRRENEALRRELETLRRTPHSSAAVSSHNWRPSRLTIAALCIALLILLVIAFFAGYLPLHSRTMTIAAEARGREQALPRMGVITVNRSSPDTDLQLPGNIQAIVEAPILARADGYLKQRLVDIGDRVQSGQTLAIIEAPELDEQVRQAQAALDQAHAAAGQADANLREGRAELELARITAKRFAGLVGDGSVSVQENDQYQAQYQSKIAAINSLEQAVVVQRSAVRAAEANVARLENIKRYRVVTAPFEGVITQRNLDSGALVNQGSTLLFRIAQAGELRIYVNVPQSHADSVHKGDEARITVSNLPARQFTGAVARTADALDPITRTLLVEIHVPNPDSALLPGMYAQVTLSTSRGNPPVVIPSTALIVSSDGTRVALVRADRRIHLQTIIPGRDYGDRIEVMGGLHAGDTVVASPSDVMHEGDQIDPYPIASEKMSR
ncbi:MAG TPA: efflux RND transporter periplasmic adaptor subunit [Bryobacteraceae bacterium]